MANYRPIRDENPFNAIHDEERLKSLKPSLNNLRRGSCFLIVSSVVIPIVTYFAGPSFYAVIVGSLFFVWQVVVGVLGYTSASGDIERKLRRFRRHIHFYFFTLIVALLLYEVSIIIYNVVSDYDNCSDQELNRVCDKRWGIMTWQMIFFMILPAVDIFVCILYLYYLRLIEECRECFKQRAI